MREPGVVNDLATADVYSVMQIAVTRCDKVRAQRRFLVTGQGLVGTVYPGTYVIAHCPHSYEFCEC